MKLLKAVFFLGTVLAAGRYLPTIYYASQFNDSVRFTAEHMKAGSDAKTSIVRSAETYSLRIKPEDIKIATVGPLVKVDIDYQVPVDLFVYRHVLSFHAAGSGINFQKQ